MKLNTFYFIILFYTVIGLLLTISSCKTSSNLQTTKKDSISYVEKIVTKTVVNPLDSANIRAKLECDKNGKILLSWFDQEVSKNANLKFKIDSIGNLLADFKSGGDSTQISYKDIYHTKSRIYYKTKYINKLNTFQKIAVYWLIISIIIIIGLIIYKTRKHL